MKFQMTPEGKKLVTFIPGDGIGPEVTRAARQIIEAANVPIEWDEQEAGASVFKKGIPSGVPQETQDSIHNTRVCLKGPLETPVGFGEKSANVTLRKLFETYGNIRPVRELPGVVTPFSGRNVDIIVVRENIEDLYAGIEYMITPDVAQGLKLISRKGCEKIIRLAFEMARSEGRKTVHCATKANIMKFTEGLVKKVFEEVATEYPDIESHHIIIDNCAHQLVRFPETFDVIVTTNMNGDIISDLTSGLVGGLGFAPSANFGSDVAIFEAVHGSAPKYAGKNVINPTALIGSSLLMLRHIEEFEAADLIENALLYTLEEGKALTRDIVGDEKSVSTTAFTEAIISNFGKKPTKIKVREYKPLQAPTVTRARALVHPKKRETIGADIFVESTMDAAELGAAIEKITANSAFNLKMISNRGTKVYPSAGAMTDCVDAYRCRFMANNGKLDDVALAGFTQKISESFMWTHIEKLHIYDGEEAFTKAQGED
jgi:isocitrate dehydrogenase